MAITYHSGERIQGTSTGVTAGYGDITGASYASKSKSITADDNNPKSITFNNDGSKMYLVGLQYSKIFEYTLSTPWDVSTAGSASTGYSVQTNPQDIFWSSDGTKLFLIRANVDTIYQYTPSSAYDITSLGTAVTRTYSDGSVDGQGIFIGDSGAKLYVINDTNNTVRQYNMSTPWDITTMSQTYNKTFDVGTTQESIWQSVVLNDDGTKMYTTGTNNDSAHQYTLTTAWDVSTASFDTGESFSMASEDTAPLTIRFGDSGKKLYMIGLANNTVYQYTNAIISSSDYTTITNVPDYSRFEETDTRKFYTKDLNGWKEKGTALEYRHASTYEQINPLTTVNKQHFVEWFSGKQLPSYWTETDIGGGGTVAMNDAVDGGLTLTSGTSIGDTVHITFNNKRQYDDDNCIMVAVCNAETSNSNLGVGFDSDTAKDYNGTGSFSFSILEWRVALTNLSLKTADGTTPSRTASDIPFDTNVYRSVKITNTASNCNLTLDGVSKVDRTSLLPTTNMQPRFSSQLATNTGAQIAHIRFMECYNT
jgi:hypothetical protein